VKEWVCFKRLLEFEIVFFFFIPSVIDFSGGPEHETIVRQAFELHEWRKACFPCHTSSRKHVHKQAERWRLIYSSVPLSTAPFRSASHLNHGDETIHNCKPINCTPSSPVPSLIAVHCLITLGHAALWAHPSAQARPNDRVRAGLVTLKAGPSCARTGPKTPGFVLAQTVNYTRAVATVC
jgi:hypothetical protein